jgi:hypothetical protein
LIQTLWFVDLRAIRQQSRDLLGTRDNQSTIVRRFFELTAKMRSDIWIGVNRIAHSPSECKRYDFSAPPHHVGKRAAVRRDFYSIVLFANTPNFAQLQARAPPLLYISMQRPSWIMIRGGKGN